MEMNFCQALFFALLGAVNSERAFQLFTSHRLQFSKRRF